MGVSTNALLVYGYVWDADDIVMPGDEAGGEWATAVLARRGIANPWHNHPGDSHSAWEQENGAELDAWHDECRAVEAEYGVAIGHHGSDTWRCPIVKIAATGHRACRGDVCPVTAADLAVDPEWDGKLGRFVADLEIDLTEARGPGWFLLSWWG